jgi:GrpB-like predicted nucleotidyltransferase (UPF0157 family)
MEPLGLESGVVRVVPYNAQWPVLYALEATRIHDGLSSRGLRVDLEHMGSTAVPGLSAKPIIDILGGWHHDDDRLALIEALTALGYNYRGEQGIPGREFFRRGDPRQYHLHLTARGGVFWQDHLLFRDLLRSNPELLEGYAALKRELAERFPREREAYIEGKTAFVKAALSRGKAEG